MMALDAMFIERDPKARLSLAVFRLRTFRSSPALPHGLLVV
ncbi:hypothetical protein BSU04_11180 [Caballeronia sordidicola]|uniref:Uncharacterized protein n=1 Tax=Caballeronia sordidicola TaxID=196367 RepID=A0A226X616_CABSO|nr:hypothetical protein BSU04_11180 [Caballeronia sordidicola]